MSLRVRFQAAVWPAMFGVFLAHQLAYFGHDDGHIHGYLDRVGPALFVAVGGAWIWTRRRVRGGLADVLVIQLILFGVMEIGERVLASGAGEGMISPVLVGGALLPIVAAWLRLLEMISEFRLLLARSHVMPVVTTRLREQRVHVPSIAWWSWAIRAPPSVVRFR